MLLYLQDHLIPPPHHNVIHLFLFNKKLRLSFSVCELHPKRSHLKNKMSHPLLSGNFLFDNLAPLIIINKFLSKVYKSRRVVLPYGVVPASVVVSIDDGKIQSIGDYNGELNITNG